MISLLTLFQVAILAAGTYAALGFLRTTRGSGLVRGLTLAFVFGAIGLSLLATRLNLEELEYIIEIITGYVVVILVVLFQPELRRGIVQLGENPLVGRLLKARRQELLTEVAKACISMAKKRQGALIAFERQNNLDSYVETAVKVDAEVNRFVLDSIFHHGSALHDGGVVLRGERIAAAACLFPLTENEEISRSTGTRHRAALGLTEETDAITVTVSEETGSISICQAGKMERNVSPTALEERLRDLLGIDPAVEAARERAAGTSGLLRRIFTENIGLKAGSLLIASGLYYVAHRELQGERSFVVRIVADAGERATGTTGQVVVGLPDASFNLIRPRIGDEFDIDIRGSRSRLGGLDQRLTGALELTPESIPSGGEALLLDLDAIQWSDEDGMKGLQLDWADEAPGLVIQRNVTAEFTLLPEMVPVDASQLDPRFEADLAALTISPTSVRIIGPASEMEVLGTAEEPLLFEPLQVRKEQSRVERRLRLSERLRARRLALEGEDAVLVVLPIRPVRESIELVREVALICSDPTQPGLASSWEAPSETARVTVITRGILPLDRSSPAFTERARSLRTWAEENLRVVVDVARIPEGSGRGTLELLGPRPDPSAFGVSDGSATVEFQLLEPETVLLSRREAPEQEDQDSEDGL